MIMHEIETSTSPVLSEASTDHTDAIIRLSRTGVNTTSPLNEDSLVALLNVCCWFRVLSVDGHIVGYACAMDRQAAYAGEAFHCFRARFRQNFLHIDQIVIAPEFHRQGFGRLLYDDIEHFARTEDVGLLTCEVDRNPPDLLSHAFHLRQGFVELASFPARGIVVTLLAKQIRNSE